MKKTLPLLIALFFCFSISAQTTKTMTWGGKQRQYLEYIPDSYDPSTPTPVIFGFHGVGKTMEYFFEVSKFYNIADEHGWILIFPQALDYRIGGIINMGTTWNAGVSATIGLLGLGHVVLQENVDDPGLVFAILDDLIARYNIDEGAIFCTGVSMGGFMSNRMAIEHGDRIKAVASVNGTIGNELTSTTPIRHISTMHIHGTADDTITYSEAGFPILGSHISLGLGAEATVEWWRSFNQCSTTPVYTAYPNTMADGKTYEQFLYEDGIDGTKTAFIKTTNGHHEWYSFPANDIDYATEIYNFFASCIAPPPVDSLPVVTTGGIADIMTSSATGGGEVISDGGAEVTARGVCWRTAHNPTLAHSHTTNGSGIGTFTSTLSGLAPNTTYYVRAYATNSVGTVYGGEVSFTTPCNPVSVTISGDTSFCEGDSITLTASGTVFYSWSATNNSANLTVTEAGTYTVTGSNQYGCSATSSFTVSVLESPAVIIDGNDFFCEGGSTTLTVSGANSYLWSTTATTPEVTVSVEGTYSVTGTDEHGCSATESITVTIPALPDITISGDTVVEPGGSTTLSVENNPDWTYLWSTGATSSSVTVTPEETTTYYITVTNGICDGEVTAFVTVTVTDSIPSDTIPGDTIPDDTTGILHYRPANIHIYPNPTNSIVTIQLSSEACVLSPEIQMFDIYGRRLQIVSVCGERPQIDMSRYAPGVYIIKIVCNGKPYAIGKVIKE